VPAGPARLPVPAGWRLVADRSLVVGDGGHCLIGGQPARLVRLRDPGARAVGRWLAGGPVGPGEGERLLARRLLDAGLAHPVVSGAADPPAGLLDLIVPVRDQPAELARLLERLGARHPVVVVDDASVDPDAIASVAAASGARLVRSEVRLGPAGARNLAAASTAADLVAFVDADCVPDAGWLALLCAHLGDPAVAAAGARVLGGRHDAGRSPGLVGAGRRVPMLPGAALVVRRTAFGAGFDPGLATGEDVDLVWRLVEAGWTVRYEPEATVEHLPARRRPVEARRAVAYGRAEAALARRHPGSVGALRVSPWALLPWVALVVGQSLVAASLAGVGAGLLRRRLGAGHSGDARLALAMTSGGLLRAGRDLGQAVGSAWLPAVAVVALPRPRLAARLGSLWVASAALRALGQPDGASPPVTGPAAESSEASGPPVRSDGSSAPPPGSAAPPVRADGGAGAPRRASRGTARVFGVVARILLDDAALCTGRWAGCWHDGILDPLRPRLVRS